MTEISLPDYLRQSLSSLERSRAARIQADIRYAFATATKEDLLGIAGRSLGHVGAAGRRRVSSLKSLVNAGLKLTGKALVEVADGIDAAGKGEFTRHAKGRAEAAWQSSVEVSKRAYNIGMALKNAATSDPTAFATTMLVLAAGFQVGGGGVDGDGGIPDFDIAALGIGGHRSPWFHSIVAGIAVESAARILIDVVATLRDKLPESRDPIFDGIIKIIDDASLGVSAGISYHLLVDGVVQPAPYHGVPVSLPIEIHQAGFVANAAVEGHSARERAARPGRSRS